jgi:hypothetical protein
MPWLITSADPSSTRPALPGNTILSCTGLRAPRIHFLSIRGRDRLAACGCGPSPTWPSKLTASKGEVRIAPNGVAFTRQANWFESNWLRTGKS